MWSQINKVEDSVVGVSFNDLFLGVFALLHSKNVLYQLFALIKDILLVLKHLMRF